MLKLQILSSSPGPTGSLSIAHPLLIQATSQPALLPPFLSQHMPLLSQYQPFLGPTVNPCLDLNQASLLQTLTQQRRMKRSRDLNEEDEEDAKKPKRNEVVVVDSEESACSLVGPCCHGGDGARAVAAWSVDEVADFVGGIEHCEQYKEVIV